MYLLGYDIGSSSVKASLVDASTGHAVKSVQYPEREFEIISLQVGWAEQAPEIWWESLCHATQKLLSICNVNPRDIKSIGIAYQMHGLVLVDKDYKVLRPSIIWCDSRAVQIGEEAFDSIGKDFCLNHLLNSPGNFTASKLRWVKENEPEIFSRIYKVMLPGDYIAMKLTGEICTSVSGLSEGILWDFKNHRISSEVLSNYDLDSNLIPQVVDSFSDTGQVTESAAQKTGLIKGIPVTYRAGDQPNNALSLGVYKPNEIAATGGTSGVVYGITNEYVYDEQQRINGFAHVNHSALQRRIGLLLCINGAGIQYSWLRKLLGSHDISYSQIEDLMRTVSIGAEGLRIVPFGNGSERMLSNKNTGAQFNNLHFNKHSADHLYRAGIEGIAFSFVYGFNTLKKLGLNANVIKVGNDNLFQSNIFASTVSHLMDCSIVVMNTTGATGAAKASGIANKIFTSLDEAFSENQIEKIIEPNDVKDEYKEAYQLWLTDVESLLNRQNKS